jgi:hypothetical protein
MLRRGRQLVPLAIRGFAFFNVIGTIKPWVPGDASPTVTFLPAVGISPRTPQ